MAKAKRCVECRDLFKALRVSIELYARLLSLSRDEPAQDRPQAEIDAARSGVISARQALARHRVHFHSGS